MRRKKKVRPTKDVIDDLYQAVQQYVEARGGKLVVIGGVEVQQWPEDLQHNFRVAIRCTGKKPMVKP